jgi:hypothetical protein
MMPHANDNTATGYILLSRSLIGSEIMKKPPLYLKVWVLLLCKAQHKQFKQLQRGQLLTSIPELIEECSYYNGASKKKPTRDQIFQVIDWLRKPSADLSKASMIATTKATHGMLITICNYDYYQSATNYESNTESTLKAMPRQRQPFNINKNDKNVKKEMTL